MSFPKTIAFVSTTFAAALFLSGAAQASRIPKIELLREVTVAGSRVLLSDLLPANASESLRARASQIAMGATPLPGNARVLERDAIESQVSPNGGILSEVSIPDRIVVRTDSRAITLNEVFETIRAALAQKGLISADALRPEDVLLESQILVAPGDSGLQVMRMDLDRGLRRARFLLWPSHSPKVLPFFATAKLEGDLEGLSYRAPADLGHIANTRAVVPAAARPAKAEILVGQGERATLLLRSETLRMFVDVVSLERGTLGQQIRVRMTETGKILNARVDGRSHLEVTF
jgi:hypothetical protein